MELGLKQFETFGKVHKLLTAMGQTMTKMSGKYATVVKKFLQRSATLDKKSGKVSKGGE